MGRRGDGCAPCVPCSEEGAAVSTFCRMDIPRVDAAGLDTPPGWAQPGSPGTGGRCWCAEVAVVTGGRRGAVPRGPPAVSAAVLLMLRCRRLCLPCAVSAGV